MAVAWARDGARLTIRSRLSVARVVVGLALTLPGVLFLAGLIVRAVQPPAGAAPRTPGQVAAVLAGSLFFLLIGLFCAFYRRRVVIDAGRGVVLYQRELLAARLGRAYPLDRFGGVSRERMTTEGSAQSEPSVWYSVRLRGKGDDWIEVAAIDDGVEAEALRSEVVSVIGGRRG